MAVREGGVPPKAEEMREAAVRPARYAGAAGRSFHGEVMRMAVREGGVPPKAEEMREAVFARRGYAGAAGRSFHGEVMRMAVREGGVPPKAEEMREAAVRLLEGLRESDPAQLAGTLFRDDGDFTSALVESLPRLVSAAAHAVKAFAESMEGMPAQEAAELVARSYAQVKGEEIGEALNALSRLVIRLHEENPELFASFQSGLFAEAVQAIDFGKLRKAVTYRVGERLDLARREVELLGDSPMALINMFSVVAPVINDALKVLRALFDILALPAEAVTYALFKILQDLDWNDVAAVINGASAFIVNVHRGSLILGDGSLYSREPLQRISSDLIGAIDGQVLAEAIAAVGEEAEALASALANRVLENEELAVRLFEATVSLANSFFLFASSFLEKANSLSREALGKMATSMSDGLEVGELGRAIASLASLGRRMVAENPGLVAGLSRQTLSALGLEAGPEAAARGVNRAIESYNQWLSGNPEALADRTSAFLAGIDAQELERAAKATGDQVAAALRRNPSALKPLLKAAISVLVGGIRGYVKGIWTRRRTRGV
ncbi:MAG: hypothetical protein HPY75_12230 [Actinobacteria bacterium]|nr:hypothetical protein [Actinomycetota bacterium]